MNKRYLGRNTHSLEATRDPIRQNILDLKSNYNFNEDGSPGGNMNSSSSIFNYSTTSSQAAKAPYWDLLSLDDAREYEKQMTKEREAKLRAQRQLRSCLEGQMRENTLKNHINKLQNKSNHELIIDRMKQLDLDHQEKVMIL